MQAEMDSALVDFVVRLLGQGVHGCWWFPELNVPILHAAAVPS